MSRDFYELFRAIHSALLEIYILTLVEPDVFYNLLSIVLFSSFFFFFLFFFFSLRVLIDIFFFLSCNRVVFPVYWLEYSSIIIQILLSERGFARLVHIEIIAAQESGDLTPSVCFSAHPPSLS